MEEKENFGSICITFRKGEEIEVVMSDIEVLRQQSGQNETSYCYSTLSRIYIIGYRKEGISYVDAFVREARWDSRALFFGLAEKYRELLHCGHRYISPVVPRQKGLPGFISLNIGSLSALAAHLALQVEKEHRRSHDEMNYGAEEVIVVI